MLYYSKSNGSLTMPTLETTLFLLLIILSFGLIVPELFKKLRVPYITTLIILGSIIGPKGFGYIVPDESINFFGFLGMTFLMLMAGLETDIDSIKKLKYKIGIMAIANSLIPFLAGVGITRAFGYAWLPSILVGTIFISSSVAIIIPSLKAAKLLKKDIGKLILSAVLIADVLSLFLLAFILQGSSPITKLPLPAYFVILILSILVLFLVLPQFTKSIFKRHLFNTDEEQQLRVVLVLTIGVLVYFSALGVHPILAAFIVGLALSRVLTSKKIRQKLHTLGFGLFVPVFFVIVGMEMDLKFLVSFDISNLLMISIVLGLISSKFISGFVSGKMAHLKNKNAALFGTASIIQLTTTLAVTYAASSIGIFDDPLTTSIIILSIITTIVGPVALKFLARTS